MKKNKMKTVVQHLGNIKKKKGKGKDQLKRLRKSMWWYKRSREDSNKYYVSQREHFGKEMIYNDIWENITSRVRGAEARFQYDEEYMNWEKWNNTYWKLIWEWER